MIYFPANCLWEKHPSLLTIVLVEIEVKPPLPFQVTLTHLIHDLIYLNTMISVKVFENRKDTLPCNLVPGNLER